MRASRALSPRRRRAPLALLHYPSVLAAVLGAALLASLAASSSPFVTTAAASAALDNRLAELTPLATGLEISGATALYPRSIAALLRDAQRREAAAGGLAGRLGGVGRPILTTESNEVYVLGAGGDTPVRLMTRTGALRHVKILARVPGGGVWISSIVAETAHLRPGGLLRFDTATFGGGGRLTLRIKGVYRALAQSPQTPFWEHFFGDIYPRTPDQSPPPSYVFLGQRDLYRVLLRLTPAGGGYGPRGPNVSWTVELPVDPAGMTLAGARRLDRRFEAVRHELRSSSLGRRLGCTSRYALQPACSVGSSLSSAVTLADRNAGAVTAAVGLLSDLGTLIALGVVAAAGAFLVRRRRVEAALLYARGEHVAAFGVETAVAALVPLLAGAAAGFGLAYVLTSVFAPTGSTDPSTARTAAAHAAATAGVALLLLVATASLAFLRLYETGVRRAGWLRRIPWELPVLGVAVYLLVEVETGGGMSRASTGTTHPTLAVFLFPLLLVAGVAGLAARLARLLLRWGRLRGPGGPSAPVYLALRRLAAARGLVIVLAVVSAVALGAFCYADALEASLGRSTVEKAYMATGSDAQALVADNGPLPAGFPYPITRVEFANQNASIDGPGGDLVDVMLVDPASIVTALHWQSGWGPNPTGLIRNLASSPSSPLPVIVTPGAARMHRLSLQGDNLPVRILGTVSTFPEMSAGIPLVITSYRALDQAAARAGLHAPLGIVQTYVWGRGPPLQVERALTSSSLELMYPSTIETYLDDPNVLLATRTFSFMRTIAIAAGVLVLVGLVLYLQARQRSQVIASALARRMGLGRAAESLSLAIELGAILVFAALVGGGIALAAAHPIVGHIDPLPQDPPVPVFALPAPGLLAVAGGLALAAVVSGLLTSWLAGRADVSEALRID